MPALFPEGGCVTRKQVQCFPSRLLETLKREIEPHNDLQNRPPGYREGSRDVVRQRTHRRAGCGYASCLPGTGKGIVAIDLKDVHIVDREAIKLLAMLEVNGLELRNSPAYIPEWVTRETGDRNTSEERTKRSERDEDA